MKIRTKLNINFIAVGLFLLIFIITVFYQTSSLRQAFRKEQVIEKITDKAFESILLRNEYLNYPSERPKAQWIIVYNAQLQLLDQARPFFSSTQEKMLFGNIENAVISKKMLFDELVKSIEHKNSDTVIEELNNQLTLKTQILVSNAQILADLSRKQTENSGKNMNLIVIVFGSLIAVISIVTYSLAAIISKSLRDLGKGTQIIASGNLEYQLPVESQDEIGLLARLFNNMAAKLAESYATLEKKVSDRTQELEKRRTELEQSQKAVRNVLEDLLIQRAITNNEKAKDEAMLASIADGLIIVDMSGKITFANKAALNLLGWNSSQFIGKSFFDVVPMENEKSERVPARERPMALALSTDIAVKKGKQPAGKTKTIPGVYYYLRKDNTKFPVAITVANVVLDNKMVGGIEVFRDITREKEIDKAKTEFVSLASHQLRTPTTAVNWFSNMLLNEEVGTLNPQQRDYLNQIYTGNKRMINLIGTLLNVSRIDAGSLIISPEKLNLCEICKSVLEELKPQIIAKKIKLIENYESQTCEIQADRKLIYIVFQNVLTNAVNYNLEGGIISVSIVPRPEDRNLGFLITVTDNGIGIPQAQQPGIFTKLFRADNARETVTDGTGLGLYMVKAAVDYCGGSMSFQSPASPDQTSVPVQTGPGPKPVAATEKKNPGTTFYINLPLVALEPGKAGSILL